MLLEFVGISQVQSTLIHLIRVCKVHPMLFTIYEDRTYGLG